jgi:hypothetical protein
MPRLTRKTVSQRNRRVPIRVDGSATEAKRSPQADEYLEAHQPEIAGQSLPPATNTKLNRQVFQLPVPPVKRSALIWGMGFSFILILTVWFGVLRFRPQPSGPNSADETIANIGRGLSGVSDQFNQQFDNAKRQINTVNDSTTPEVRLLQQQVFPEFTK